MSRSLWWKVKAWARFLTWGPFLVAYVFAIVGFLIAGVAGVGIATGIWGLLVVSDARFMLWLDEVLHRT